MTRKQPPNVSIAHPAEGGKLVNPAAERNTAPLCDLLARHAPKTGNALEIASGTGQHVAAFARLLPGLTWQPTDIEAERLVSIDAYARDSGLTNIKPAQRLDACRDGWSAPFRDLDMVSLCNLLHLIPVPAARCVVDGAMGTLRPGGRFMLYGPFLRDGKPVSEGDARFHESIVASDPALGYKNAEDVEDWLRAAGAAEVARHGMPSNNLAFIATR